MSFRTGFSKAKDSRMRIVREIPSLGCVSSLQYEFSRSFELCSLRDVQEAEKSGKDMANSKTQQY